MYMIMHIILYMILYMIMYLIKKKGDRFFINGIEIAIADNPENKPVSIEVKPKAGLTGKVNLKVYAKNNRGSATIMITKPRGGDVVHVKNLAFNVIKYILDKVISGEIKKEDIDLMRKKSSNKTVKNKCEFCKKEFVTYQELKLHITSNHKNMVVCILCESKFLDDEEFVKHNQKVHSEVRSPDSKRIKMKVVKDSDDTKDEEEVEIS